MSFVLNTIICITCTVHRTVISVEHFAIASAGFFVLLASFAVQRKGYLYTIKLKTYNCIVFTNVSTHKIISLLFKISASALFLKYS